MRCGVMLLTLCLSAAALAAEGPDLQSAQEHVRLATGFFKRGHYAQALEELRKANALVPHTDYVYNMARCYEEMGRPADAVEHFTRYLETGKDDKKRTKARDAVLRLVPLAFGSVEVTCDPPDATVRIEGVAEGPCPLRQDRVRAGTWRVIGSAEGRVGAVASLEVKAGELARLELTLGQEPGRLDVSSDPPGAAVIVDGAGLGVTPLQGIDLPEGRHEVRLELDGYGSFVERVNVQSGQRLRVDGRLEQRKGRLRITSDPVGAVIRVDGKQSGHTPLDDLELPPGVYVVELESGWHSAWRQRVQLAPDQALELHGALPSRLTAWALAGATAVAALGAAGTYALALGTLDDRDASKDAYDVAADRATANGLADDVLAAEAQANTLLLTSRLLGGVAGALAASSIVAFLFSGAVEEPSPMAGPSKEEE